MGAEIFEVRTTCGVPSHEMSDVSGSCKVTAADVHWFVLGVVVRAGAILR